MNSGISELVKLLKGHNIQVSVLSHARSGGARSSGGAPLLAPPDDTITYVDVRIVAIAKKKADGSTNHLLDALRSMDVSSRSDEVMAVALVLGSEDNCLTIPSQIMRDAEDYRLIKTPLEDLTDGAETGVSLTVEKL